MTAKGRDEVAQRIVSLAREHGIPMQENEPLAALLARLLGSMLYEVSTLDPIVFTAAPLLLTAASMLACYLPARRASRVDQAAVLRGE